MTGFYSAWLGKTGSNKPAFGPANRETKSAKVNHWVAIGTKANSRKLVFFRLPYPNAF
jgi:hypothetical protein